MDITQTFRKELEAYRQKRGLQKQELAALIGISPQHMSDFLNREKGLSIETTLKAVKLLNKGNKNMTTTTTTDYTLQNDAVLRKYHAAKHAKITKFQSGLGQSEDGFVPGATAEPATAEVVAQLVRDGRIKEATDLLIAISKGTRVTTSTATKAVTNREGVTQPLSLFLGQQKILMADGSTSIARKVKS
jgi:plasmid maintenance system antidote protein VapI